MSRQIITPDKQYIYRTAVSVPTSAVIGGIVSIGTSITKNLSTAFIVLNKSTGHLGFNIEDPIAKFHFFGDTVISGNLRVVGTQLVDRVSTGISQELQVLNTGSGTFSTAMMVQSQAGFPLAVMRYKNPSTAAITEVLRVQNDNLSVANEFVGNDLIIGHDLYFSGNIFKGGEKFISAREAPEVRPLVNVLKLRPEDPKAEEGWQETIPVGFTVSREFQSVYVRGNFDVDAADVKLTRNFIFYDPAIVGSTFIPTNPNSRFVAPAGKYVIQITYLLDQGFQKVKVSLDGVPLEESLDLYSPAGFGATRQTISYTADLDIGNHSITVEGLAIGTISGMSSEINKHTSSSGYGLGIGDITLLNLGLAGNVVKLTDAEATNLIVKSSITIRGDISGSTSIPGRLNIYDRDNDTYLQIRGGASGSNVAVIAALDSTNMNTVPLAIQPNANVGFGTSDPQYRLDMRGNVANDFIAHVLNDNISGSGLLIETITSSATLYPFQVRNALSTSQVFMAITGQGRVGYNISTPQAGVHYNFTDSVIMPVGTTLQRPSGIDGMIRFNSTLGVFEAYGATPGGWTILGSSPIITWISTAGAIYYNGGNVGIGTSAPTYQLDVYTPGAALETGIRVADTTGNVVLDVSSGNGVVNASGNLLLETNSVDRMIINSVGNVGIGTMTPNSLLHVNGTITATDISLSGTIYSGTPLVFTNQTISNTLSVGGLTQLSDLSVSGNATIGGNVIVNTNIIANGNVGIGTTTAVEKFEVNGYGAFISRANVGLTPGGIRIGNSTKNDLYIDGDSAGYLFQDGTTKFLRISSTSGNVYMGNSGIITNPNYRLQVDGDINFTGNVYQNGIQYGPTFEAPFIDKYPWETADSDSNENIVPVGSYITYSDLAALPTNYLRCDGSAISRTTYAELFGVIGTIYGIGDGSTTFTLPTIANTIIKYITPVDSSKHIVPVGSILFTDATFHSTIPAYYLPTNGAAVNRIAYSELFAVVGTIYGSGDGLTTFNLPNVANSIIKISSAPSGQLEIFPLAVCLSYSSSILTVPANYIRTDGSEISRGVYADLYRVIKQTYGAGDGLTTFALPTLSNRIMRFTNSVHITYMDGRVGVGESNPQYNLDVAGDINFTGDIYKNGTLWREDSTAPIPMTPWVACDQSSIEDLVPVGSFVSFLSSATLPADYFLCDGSAISRTTYSQLFAVIGTSYGVGDGLTTFNLPFMFNMIIKYQSATGANKSKVFIGSYLSYPWSSTLPVYYLQCDGTEVSRTTYAALFAIIGTAYGSGDGLTTFNLPFFYNYIIKYDYPISGVDSLEVGLMLSYGGSTAPTNYVFADGSEVSRHSYSELFDVISTGYGAGNGYTTFNLPSMFATIIRYTKNGTSVCYSGNVAIGKTTASYPLDVSGVVQASNTPKAFLSLILDYFSNPGTFKYSFLRSYNVASVSYTSASGNVDVMTVNFTNSMSSRNYVVQASESPYYYNAGNSYITTGNYVSKLAITNYATGGFSCSLLGSTGQNLTPGRLDFVVYDSETNIYNGTPSGSAV